MTPLKISVIIVAYKAQYVISDCVDSLLRQTYPKESYEIILVVDDKETFDAVKDYSYTDKPRVKIEYRNKPGNIPSARNVGIHLSDGEIIAFTDSDCIASEHWLETLNEEFKQLPAISGVGGSIKPYSLDPVSRSLALLNMVSLSGGKKSYKRHLATSNAAYRNDVLMKMGGFDEYASVGEDIDIYRRIIQDGHQILYDPEIVIYHKHRMKLLSIFFWCYSSAKKSVYIQKKYKEYTPLVRQTTPALTILALIILTFVLGLYYAFIIVLILVIVTYIITYIYYRKNEYYSNKTWVILPLVVLTISFGFLNGSVIGYLENQFVIQLLENHKIYDK